MRDMKSKMLLCLLFAAALLGSCTSDDQKEVLTGGTPVEVSLSFALAEVEYPQEVATSGDESGVKSSSVKAQIDLSSINGSIETQTTTSAETAAKTETTKVASAGRKAASKNAASKNQSPLQVSYTVSKASIPASTANQTADAAGFNDAVQLRSGTSISNVWVLQFDSTQTAGAFTPGDCVVAKYLGTLTTGDNLNPTLLVGTGQVIYVIANGPEAGDIATDSYTLETFKNSAYFSGSITNDASMPYIGRIEGGAMIVANGEVYSAASVPVITLYRIGAKISLDLNFAVTGYTVSSVQLFNTPAYIYYVNGASTAAFPTESYDFITTGLGANITPSTAATGTYTWYTGENKRGTSGTATTAYLKDFLHTPGDSYYCSYIRVKAKKNDSTSVINYYLYLGENGTTDFNVKRNWNYSITAAMGGSETDQQNFMKTDGRIRTATSNCYIVAPGSTITIPVNVRGNANEPLPPDASSTVLAGTGLSPYQSTAAATVSVLWQTSAGLITVNSLNTTTQIASITANAEGNGVVVAKDALNNILWSWHFWATNYNPNLPSPDAVFTYSLNTGNPLTFMDRNLGATTNTTATASTLGLHYQWGRKDPFPGSASVSTGAEDTIYNAAGTGSNAMITKIPVSAASNLPNSILNPLTFYNGTDGNNYDWYSFTAAIHNNALWGGASTVTPTTKTIFDPCPVGWRVPAWRDKSPWDIFTKTNFPYSIPENWTSGFGRVYTDESNTYYPAAGCRHNAYGSLYDVGNCGYYWSASQINNYGNVLRFTSSIVYPSYYGYRAHACSIRCVQE